MNIKRKRYKSPMHEILDEVSNGTNSANGVVARLWRIILKHKNMQGHQWERLLERWRVNSVELYGEKDVSFKKSNMVKALAAPNMTWKTFMQGLQVLNSTNKYKCIRFEVHFVPRKGKVTEIIGINVIDRTSEGMHDNHGNINILPLVPTGTAMPNNYYRLSGFENGLFNGCVLRYKGSEEVVTSGDMFNGYTTIGSMVLMSDGMDSPDWIVQQPPRMLEEPDVDE